MTSELSVSAQVHELRKKIKSYETDINNYRTLLNFNENIHGKSPKSQKVRKQIYGYKSKIDDLLIKKKKAEKKIKKLGS